MTFSMIAYDPEEEIIASAVASKWTGVGGCVQYFRPHVGFVNMQNHSYAQVAYRILDMMGEDISLENSVHWALATDNAKNSRQCILANLKGEFYTYSGDDCSEIFHQKIGKHCAAAGNTLASKDVIEEMVRAYEESSSNKIVERLIQAMEAGEKAGGDTRGKEAASIKAYKTTYPVQRFYPIDLRVDSDPEPLQKLRHLYKVFGDHERRIVW